MEMKVKYYAALLLFVAFVAPCRGDEYDKLLQLYSSKPDQFAGKTEMNGIRFDDYKGFEDDWKLVTVRYREDSREQRFTYANEKAWRALKSGKSDYPDGAVFGKVGFLTGHDPIFPSSVVPSSHKRVQLMIRDRKRYAQTDGWGYALFNSDGKTFNGEPAQTAVACAACHRIAKDRGYVFSQSMNPSHKASPFQKKIGTAASSELRFETTPRSALPDFAARNIPAGSRSVLLLKGDIQKNLFEGTLNEILPVLIQKSVASKMPTVLMSDDQRLFSAAYLEESSRRCASGEREIQTVRTIFDNSNPNETIVRLGWFCKKVPAP